MGKKRGKEELPRYIALSLGTTVGFAPYRSAILNTLEDRADFDQLIKGLPRESHYADADSQTHQIDERIFWEVGKPVGRALLHFACYNFCRIHKSLRVTPGMQARITDHDWDIAELISFS